MVFIQLVCVFYPWGNALALKKNPHDSLKKTIFIVWLRETRLNLPLSVSFDFWMSLLNINILSIWERPLIVNISHKEHYRTTNRRKKTQQKKWKWNIFKQTKIYFINVSIEKMSRVCERKYYLVCMLWPVIQTILYYISNIFFKLLHIVLYVAQE